MAPVELLVLVQTIEIYQEGSGTSASSLFLTCLKRWQYVSLCSVSAGKLLAAREVHK